MSPLTNPWMQIAGGTGITPMLQVASEVLRNPYDKTEVSLVFGNVSIPLLLVLPLTVSCGCHGKNGLTQLICECLAQCSGGKIQP